MQVKNILVILLCAFVLSCNQDLPDSPHYALSEDQKSMIIANELFQAILDDSNPKEIQEILTRKNEYLFSVNQNGDTPLGVAIQFYKEDIALYLLDQMMADKLTHINNNKEGYIYLASQHGLIKVINKISDKFYNFKSQWTSDWEFSDLDVPDSQGNKALHVAQNQAVAEALSYHYKRGSLEYPLRKLQFHLNNQDENFLHTAIRNQKTSVVRWGVENNCTHRKDWALSGYVFKTSSYVWRGLLSLGTESGFDFHNIINARNKEGDTPVQLSAQHLFTDGLRILSHCLWTDYLLPNHKGNIPLQSFLTSLDPFVEQHSEDIKEAFVLLAESSTPFTWKQISHHVNFVNLEGETSLHIAARMFDSFFYKYLKKYGDLYAENNKKETPETLHLKSQSLLKGQLE